MKAITLIKAIDEELKDKDRKDIILYLIGTMDEADPLFIIKKKLDEIVKYEKGKL